MKHVIVYPALCLIVLVSAATAATIKVPGDQPTIQAGIDAASTGDTVLVSEGIHSGPGNRDLSFNGKSITVKSKKGAEKTVIDCEQLGRGFLFNSGESNAAVLDGFTIMNGLVDGCGAGIYISGSSPTVMNNIITGNLATGSFPANGGGIYCESFSIPVIRDNVISWNVAEWWGGGISFYYNYATVTIEGNAIVDNQFMDGAVHLWESDVVVDGCTLAYNMAWNLCGGIYCDYMSRADVVDSILWDNMDGLSPNGMCDLFAAALGYIDIDYSDFSTDRQGPGMGRTGPFNITNYPMFASAGSDYRLCRESPCINAGRPTKWDPDGTVKDMGAFYYDLTKTCVGYVSPFSKTISRTGGALDVAYAMNNSLTVPHTFYYMTNIFLPGGFAFPGNPFVGPTPVTLPGGSSTQIYMSHPIPAIAPLGLYEYRCLTGVPPATLYDVDSFGFIVVP